MLRNGFIHKQTKQSLWFMTAWWQPLVSFFMLLALLYMMRESGVNFFGMMVAILLVLGIFSVELWQFKNNDKQIFYRPIAVFWWYQKSIDWDGVSHVALNFSHLEKKRMGFVKMRQLVQLVVVTNEKSYLIDTQQNTQQRVLQHQANLIADYLEKPLIVSK